MPRSWYALLVIVAWVVTTSWLVVAKILPTLLPGAPPGYQALYAADGRPIPVAWDVTLDDAPIGWSISRVDRLDDGGMRIASLLHLDDLPIGELLPAWTKFLVGHSLPASTMLSLEATGRMEIDPRGRLESFASSIELPGEPERLLLEGTIDDGDVTIVVRAAGTRYQTRRFLPDSVTVSNELSPQATLPGIVPGRRWTVPSYSPLRPAQAPLEVLHAEVDGTEEITWDGRPTTVAVVTYRDDPSSHREPRARLWVDRVGRVLRQEATLMGRRLTFHRHTDAEAEGLAGRLSAADGAEGDPGAAGGGGAAEHPGDATR